MALGLFDPLRWYARRYSALSGVPVSVTRAVMRAEGWGIGTAPTWEPTVQEYSYGPMQILGSTARGEGYDGPLEHLNRPAVGIRYGVRYLAGRLRKYGRCDAISAYNAGRPTTGNAAYVCRADPRCGTC